MRESPLHQNSLAVIVDANVDRRQEGSLQMTLEQQLEKMRQDWDARARENARHYVANGQEQWSDDEFFASGEQAMANFILNDMINICQGKDPQSMRIIEIGCGAGRLTRAFSKIFGEVHAV